MIIFGFDPGGTTGVSVLRITDDGLTTAETDSVPSFDPAIDWAVRQGHGGTPAAGIDTYLCWSTERSRWRPIDLKLRNAFPDVRASVFSSNSAYGAMAVQGMAIALRLRERWPGVILNETHPKVLYHALTSNNYMRDDVPTMTSWLQKKFSPEITCAINNEHEWDAFISTWATWQGLSGNWTADLVPDLGGTQLLFPDGRVFYYWHHEVRA